MSTTPNDIDTTRRTLAQARRIPAWQRLIDSIHAAQAAKGYAGRQFGKDEMRAFGETLIGKPVEKVGAMDKPENFAAYWVARQVFDHSDGSQSVRYVLKVVYGDNLANVHTIADARLSDAEDAAEDERTAREFIRRAQHQTGRA